MSDAHCYVAQHLNTASQHSICSCIVLLSVSGLLAYLNLLGKTPITTKKMLCDMKYVTQQTAMLYANECGEIALAYNTCSGNVTADEHCCAEYVSLCKLVGCPANVHANIIMAKACWPAL